MTINFLATGGMDFIGSAVIRHILEDTLYVIANVIKLIYVGKTAHWPEPSIPLTIASIDGRYMM